MLRDEQATVVTTDHFFGSKLFGLQGVLYLPVAEDSVDEYHQQYDR